MAPWIHDMKFARKNATWKTYLKRVHASACPCNGLGVYKNSGGKVVESICDGCEGESTEPRVIVHACPNRDLCRICFETNQYSKANALKAQHNLRWIAKLGK
jgi:uncharacterized protein (DUF1330 family)